MNHHLGRVLVIAAVLALATWVTPAHAVDFIVDVCFPTTFIPNESCEEAPIFNGDNENSVQTGVLMACGPTTKPVLSPNGCCVDLGYMAIIRLIDPMEPIVAPFSLEFPFTVKVSDNTGNPIPGAEFVFTWTISITPEGPNGAQLTIDPGLTQYSFTHEGEPYFFNLLGPAINDADPCKLSSADLTLDFDYDPEVDPNEKEKFVLLGQPGLYGCIDFGNVVPVSERSLGGVKALFND